MRDLSDTAPARQVAANIAEIDRLVRADQMFEALRRYCEPTGLTRDQAFTATQDWRNLKREEKLARFGWIVKKAPIDALDEPLL